MPMKRQLHATGRSMALPKTTRSIVLAFALAGLCPTAMAAGKLFCCIDPAGKQICGDILPQECYGRAYRELGESGRTIRIIDAPLTAEQRVQRVKEEAERKEAEVALKEQQRKDQALLNTYGSENDIEIMRQRAQDDVQKSIRSAETKIVEIRLQRKKFENEAEFYKKKRLPAEIQKGLNDADFEINAQNSIIEAKRKELGIISEKYDEDRRRFLDLTKRGQKR